MKHRRHTLFFLTLLSLALLLTNPASLFAEAAARRFCVIESISPIMRGPGLTDRDAARQREGAPGGNVVVYGNHVDARPAAGKFADDWMELLDADGDKLGYVPKTTLRPLPPYTRTETEYFWTKRDKPGLFLLPGDLPINGKYASGLLRGETVPCLGEYETPGGERWLLLLFGSAGGAGDAGARHAWGREDDFLRLETYEPDHANASSGDMPTRIRGGLESGAGDYVLGEKELARIERHGFWIDPDPVMRGRIVADDLADGYRDAGEYVPPFITTDLYFHARRLIFSHMLQKAEEKYFTRALERYLTSALAQLDERAKKIAAARPGAPREAIETARDMLALPLALLADPRLAPEKRLSPAAAMEYRKILAARGRGYSAVTGTVTDYALYLPSARYASTDALSRYFRAITFLGDATLRMDAHDRRESLLNASAAALLCLVTEGPSVRPLYDELTEPLRVMTGGRGDNSVNDFAPAARKITAGDEENITTEEKAEALRAAFLSASREPRGGGFRLIGKSFFYDAYIFENLTFPSVGTEEEPRDLPRPEDVMTALGSEAAYQLTREYAEKYMNYGFNRRVAIARTPAFLASPRAEDAYSTWLRVLADSFADSGSPQFFYRGGLWEWKKLLAASASWAELRHGGLPPVVRGSAAADGRGGRVPGKFEPPRPRGYVDPDPQVFAQILRAAEDLRTALALMKRSSLGYIDEEYERKLETFSKLCATARGIAEKEASGRRLSAEDFADIEAISRSFTPGLLLPEGAAPGDGGDEGRISMALVSDAAADNRGGRVLQAATGAPRRIFVYVNDNSAGPRVTVGYVYSYYEFERGLGGHVSDEEWRGLVCDPGRRSELEALRPAWYGRLAF